MLNNNLNTQNTGKRKKKSHKTENPKNSENRTSLHFFDFEINNLCYKDAIYMIKEHVVNIIYL